MATGGGRAAATNRELRADPPTHIIGELGTTIDVAGDELHGRADVVPEMHVPGTDRLRTSILATWTDLLAGLLAVRVMARRVPVTLDLAVDVYRELDGVDRVRSAGRIVKAGRSVVVAEVDFTTGNEAPIATATASFMAAPDVNLTIPESATGPTRSPHGARLARPFAERAGCRRREPGVAELARSEDGLNSSNTINGGLLALVVEEAALSLAPGATLASLAMRYLRPARVGPVVATASRRGELARVEVRDTGGGERLAVVATTRTFSLLE